MSGDASLAYNSWLPPSRLRRRSMNARPHALIRAAATDVGEGSVDVGVCRFWIVFQQTGDSHDHTALAVTALRDVEVEPCLLHGMQFAILRQAFDGGDLLAGRFAGRKRARPHRCAIEVDGAGAALCDAATVFGAGQPDVFADGPEERGVRFDVNVIGLSIDQKTDHEFAPWRTTVSCG